MPITLTLEELRDFLNLRESHSFEIGTCYLIRTVTMYHVGRLESVTDFDVVLSGASWVADCGRFSTCLAHGKLNEVERFPDRVGIARGAIVDFAIWNHDLPEETK